MNPRVFLRFCPVLLLPILVAPLAAQGPTGRAWCFSNVGDSVYYSSNVFDDHMKAGSPYRSRVMGYEYAQYLYGHYDMGHAGPFAGNCTSYTGTVLAETARQTNELQATQAKKRLVSVAWSYNPDSAEVEFSYTALGEQGGHGPDLPKRKDDEGFCLTDNYAEPLYTSAVFPVPASGANLGAWQIAWMKYLGGKYGFKGEVYCSNNGRGDPRRMVAARIKGAKDTGRKVIETGWSYTAPAAVAAKPDDDPEPPKPGAPPPPPSAQLRDAAAKTSSEALGACQNDRLVSGAFDCYMVQRMVYNYIIAHPADATTPAAAFLANDKLDCKDCINQFAETWASNRAMSNGYSGPKSHCVGPKFLAAIKAKPYANRVKEFFDAAMKACPK